MVDKPRHMSVGVLFTTCPIQVGGLISVLYEYMQSLTHSMSYYILICHAYISDYAFTCHFIPENLLGGFEMQISCLPTDHDFSI